MLPNHAPLAVAERLPHARSVVSRPHRSRHRQGAGHRSHHLGGAAPPPGHPRRRRLPRAVPGTDADREPRVSRRPSVPQYPRDARRRRIAAGLSPRLERLQRGACRRDRRGLCVRAPLRDLRCGRCDDELSQSFSPIDRAHAAACNSRRRRGLRRQRRRGRPPCHYDRSQFPAAFQGRVSAAGEPGGGRGLSLFGSRPRTHPREPHPRVSPVPPRRCGRGSIRCSRRPRPTR